MVIKHNMSSLNVQRQYNITWKVKSKNAEKLSSGYRINRAADDAAGLSISEKMRRQIRGLARGIQNAEDGVSLCQVADGALNEVHGIIQRLNELAVQASNGTNAHSDRELIQDEVGQLLTEIDRISDTTTFNEKRLFGGAGVGEMPQEIDEAAQTETVTPPKPQWVACGDFEVSGGTKGTDYDFDDAEGLLTIKSGKAITVKNKDSATATKNCIKVADNVKANVTLAGVNIDASERTDAGVYKRAAFDTTNASSAITLVGDNKLKSGNYVAGIYKYAGCSLTISGDGSLEAIGGYNAAGIGGGNWGDVGDITINGGTITAKGGTNGAGIGGGHGRWGTDITINGGTVTAIGGNDAAGIGGGGDGGLWGGGMQDTSGRNIAINGGIVTAIAGSRNAQSIGAGYSYDGSSIINSTGNTVGGMEAPTGKGQTYIIAASEKGALIIDDKTKTGTVSGKMTLKQDFEIPADVTVTVAPDATLTIYEGVTLTNKGRIDNNGTIDVYGDFKEGILTGIGKLIYHRNIKLTKKWWIQCGNDAKDGMYINIDTMNTKVLGLTGLNVTVYKELMDKEMPGARTAGESEAEYEKRKAEYEKKRDAQWAKYERTHAITKIGRALTYISRMRAKIGAQQNRLEHTIANENNIVENTTAAESRIRDADMAEKMVGFSLSKLVAQAGEAMMSQANQSNQGVMVLLQ